MSNRRQYYRHDFPPTRPIVVRLQALEGTPAFEGELVDLSIGGMCVYASALKTARSGTWLVSLPLEGTGTVRLQAVRVHARVADETCCGFRFLEDEDVLVLEDRDRAISKFLLDEQRRRRRHLRGEMAR